jgi:hypothetical protein
MDIDKKWIMVILGIVAAAILIWFILTKFVFKQQQQQALQVPSPTPIPVSPPPTTPSLPPFTVQSGSYLANFAGMPVTIAPTPPQLQIGDSYWVTVQTPNGLFVLIPFPINVAQQKIAQGLLTPNASYIVQVVPTSISTEMKMSTGTSTEMKMQSATYAAYGTQTITLTAGVLRDIMRGNKSLFNQLYQAVTSDNFPLVNQIISSLANNPQLQQIAKVLSVPGNMAAPLAITYNAAMTLGIVPPQIQSYVTNPSAVIIDFGYA